MLALWSSTTKALGHHVTRILLEVFKDWNEEEVITNKSITLSAILVFCFLQVICSVGCSLVFS